MAKSKAKKAAYSSRVAAAGEASEKRVADPQPADESQGDGGVAAAPSPPSTRFKPPKLVRVIDSRVGVALHYEVDGQLIRENCTIEVCDERIAAMAHAPEVAALWAWKKKQIESHTS
jgi:hypothetical protein